MRLTDEEQAALDAYERQLQLVRDRTRGVAEGWSTGFWLWGEGGISKTYTVMEELRRLDVPFVHRNSRMSGRGLMDELEEHPDGIFLLEDVESIINDKAAAGVLRSALGENTPAKKGEMRVPREVTWTACKTSLSVCFTGGIIFTMNQPLDDVAELRAVKTRIEYARLDPTEVQIAAMMRRIALKGYQRGGYTLKPKQCWEVAEKVIARAGSSKAEVVTTADGKVVPKQRLNLRTLNAAFQDRLQFIAGHSETDWEDMLESRFREEVIEPKKPLRRAERVGSEAEIAARLNHMDVPRAEKIRMWKEQTGKSERAFYRRLEV